MLEPINQVAEQLQDKDQEIQELKALSEQQKALIKNLYAVADCAAMATIDLYDNEAATNKLYMAGALSNGMRQRVMDRRLSLHAALYAAGYTGTHPHLKNPTRPE